MPLKSGLSAGLRSSATEWGPSGPSSFAGSLPATMGALSGWTGTAMWDVAWNFGDCTAGSCASLAGSTSSVTLSDLSADPTELSGPQAGWANQGGIRVTTATQLLFSGNAALTVSTTIPSAYMLVFSCAAGPSGVQTIMSGYTGFGSEGWGIEALGASGLRVRAMGSASSYVTSSTSAFDGLPHAIMVVVDDAAGKVKLFTEWGTAELTGLTYSQTGANLLTIGPESTGASWYEPVDYYQAAHGKHPLAYTNAAAALSTYHTALTTGVEPAAITGLPTTLAELNGVLGTVSMTHGWNLGSLTPAPITGASGPSLAAFTGAMSGSANGTAPTLVSAPQVRNSFASQAAIACDSTHDNLYGAGAMPKVEHTAIVVWRSPSTAYTGSYVGTIIGIPPTSVAGTEQPWRYRATATGTLEFNVYDSFSALNRTANVSSAGVNTDEKWRVSMHTRGVSGSPNRINPAGIAPAASVNSTTARNAALVPADGGFFRLKDDYQNTRPLEGSRLAFFAWTATVASNANVDAAVDAFRWRYGL